MKYLDRFQKTLIDPTREEAVAHEPLIVFSYYLAGRVSVLCSFGDEIIQNLDKGFSGAYIDGDRIARASSLMWFWLLGAYEVVRTMHQAKGCFSDRLVQELVPLKKMLAAARMPAAKMEKQGKKEAVTSNRSAVGWDSANRDLFVNDPEDSKKISARWLISEFDRVYSSITEHDVVVHHSKAYEEASAKPQIACACHAPECRVAAS